MKVIDAATGVSSSYDLLVIGAGPAGMAAAATAATFGVSTLIADENGSPGGQIYRGITRSPIRDERILGEDYWHGRKLVLELEASAADYAPQTTIWSIAPLTENADQPEGFEVGLRLRGSVKMVTVRHIIAATGAMERPFPIPGWTLPGVMTAGAAQIALKTSGLVPKGRIVVAGSGPLLYLLTAQLANAGAQINLMLDTTPRANWWRAVRHMPGFLRSAYFGKGLKLLRACRKIPIVRGVTAIEAEGAESVRSVRYRTPAGEKVVEADIVLLHQGVVPSVNLSNAIGVDHAWDEVQLAFVPKVDPWFHTNVQGLSIAGDGAGIAGAESAALRGRISALGAANRLKRLPDMERDARAAPTRAALERAESGRRFIDLLYRPAKAFRVPENDETIVCRCEEVTAGKLREVLALGVTGPNQAKSFIRCGMGPCQGRMCSLTVTELIAQEIGSTPEVVGSYRLRPPFKPITLGELASLPYDAAAVRAVERLSPPAVARSAAAAVERPA